MLTMAAPYDEEKEKAESYIAEIQKKITDAFDIFDHESNNTVDVREVGTIVRSLKCCPTEGELHDLLAEVEEEEATGYIRGDKFLPVMTRVMLERRYKPSPEDMLLKAFAVLDSTDKGYLTKDELVRFMTEEGEPFTKEEIDEMLSAALDADQIFFYKEYIPLLVVEDT